MRKINIFKLKFQKSEKLYKKFKIKVLMSTKKRRKPSNLIIFLIIMKNLKYFKIKYKNKKIKFNILNVENNLIHPHNIYTQK